MDMALICRQMHAYRSGGQVRRVHSWTLQGAAGASRSLETGHRQAVCRRQRCAAALASRATRSASDCAVADNGGTLPAASSRSCFCCR